MEIWIMNTLTLEISDKALKRLRTYHTVSFLAGCEGLSKAEVLLSMILDAVDDGEKVLPLITKEEKYL
jgi:primosomal protein N'